ncbi:polyketide synthase [Cercophora newfieldiana]|uniref:Polyketide synthase n=1 Tax=Cercophora newfieldiana TaxID=92897 RepID=A0AA39YBF6_9PEZI|nr:polyketide synthase [Cercophora newfieldiana]
MHLLSPEDNQGHWQGTANGLSAKEPNGLTQCEGQTDFWNKCVHELLERTSNEFHDKTALICGDRTLSFSELDSLSDRISRALIHRHVGEGDLVGVALDRSVELIAALIGVWKTGAAYVPIDPTLPTERIHQMLEDAEPKLVVAHAGREGDYGEASTLSVEEVGKEGPLEAEDARIRTPPSALAYVMYTSGSTGRPKGVEVTHANIVNLLRSLQRDPGCKPTDRLLAITTVSFDMAVVEIFLPLITGATVVIAQRDEVRNPSALVALMERHGVTIMQGTPALWQMLLDSGWRGEPRLQKIFCGGEALPRRLANRLLDCTDAMWNMYGPTEVTVYASIWKVERGEDVVIGGPVTNYHLYVLDNKFTPVPPGSPGELCVGGAGVARGYRKRESLSREKFVPNPFHGGVMYRTGDLAKLLSSGSLTVMGRMDGQVKIRGYRIEVGDVEAAILQHEDVSGAVVVCQDDRLVAFCVPKPNQKAATGTIDRALRPWLARQLPGYMVPAFFISMEKFPVTANGKVDRKALSNLPAINRDPPAPTKAPPVDVKGKIVEAWRKVLGHDNFGPEDSFFDLGGDSLRLIRVQQELQASLGRVISVASLFEHFTIKKLTAHIVSAGTEEKPQRLVEFDRGRDADIAIVSMACRLPGGIATPEEFWDLLHRGGDAITEVPKDRWDAETLYDFSPDTPGKAYCKNGGFVSNIDSFDRGFFGISPREARSLDPAQYLMLETCWEGFERVGYTMEKLQGSSTGVFIGTSNILGHLTHEKPAQNGFEDLDGYKVTGTAGATMSGRISYHFGLQGPTMTVDTACSSSLVATHLACTALRQGECDLAVSGGVSLLTNPGLHVEFSRLQGMSPDGRCRAFSADADGTGWSEGSVAVVLKRLSDAQRDGDTIHGVIRGSAVNHDGRSASLTTPSGSAQRRLVQKALSAGRLQPKDIDYVEAHGTGTKLGDPIEATALAEVFGPGRMENEPLLIGSVKSNVGHTQAAAGLVGLLKVVLAMRHSTLPKTLHVSKPTPVVDWNAANMAPILDDRPWRSQGGRLRRAGISAFGIGGTNAHVVVEEPPEQVANGMLAAHIPPNFPFVLSGDSDEALLAQAEKLHRHVNETADSLGDIAFSLATTRSHFRKRLAIVADGKTQLLDRLDSVIRQGPARDAVETPKLAMLFTGQGSQYPGMGKGLASAHPVFDEAIREIASCFDDELDTPLLEVMWSEPGDAASGLLDRTDFAQAALFALELALWRLWQQWGVQPDFLLGHSLGELVAAHVAGVFGLADACRLVAARGRLMQAQTGDYAMLSLEASGSEAAESIERLGRGAEVEIALQNTPSQTIVSGVRVAVEEVAASFVAQGRKTKTVVDGHAFHSRFLDNALDDFRALAKTVDFKAPNLKIISSVTGREVEPGEMQNAEYWVRHLRDPVLFVDAVRELGRRKANVFLELGPQKVLSGMGPLCLEGEDGRSDAVLWLHSLTRNEDDALTLHRCLSLLHTHHVSINWKSYFKPFGCHRVQLPTYAFRRKSFRRSSIGRDDSEAGSTQEQHQQQQQGQAQIAHPGHLQFGVSWAPVIGSGIEVRGTWGYVVPTSKPTPWVERLISYLQATNLDLVPFERFEDAKGAKLEGLFSLWDSDADVFEQTQQLIPLALSQLQTAAQTRFLPTIVWLTRRAVGTGVPEDDATIIPGVGSLLWGLARTTRSEHPELKLRLIDLSEDTSPATLKSAIAQSLHYQETECAVRHGKVFVPRMKTVSPSPLSETNQSMIRKDGAVLITGGLGHIGMCAARWLAKEHGIRDLIITSRRGMETPGATNLVMELGVLGARVKIVPSDISNMEGVSELMKIFNEDRPLRGVIHAAGISGSGVLASTTPERCLETVAPKAHGAWLLHEATKDMDLDIFVMFSSISGILGMPGLASYAAANTFLDALAHFRRGRGLPGTSVAYGTWGGDGGMASSLAPTAQSYLARFGLSALSPEGGLKVMDCAVRSQRALTVGAVLDLERVRRFFDDQESGAPPLLRELLPPSKSPSLKAGQPPKHMDLREVLQNAETIKHFNIVLDMVREVAARTLGFSHSSEVEVTRSLKEIGIDSLTAVQIRNRLESVTRLKLSANIIFLHKDLKALTQFLLSTMYATDPQEGGTREESAAVIGETDIDEAAICNGYLDSTFNFSNFTQTRANTPGDVLLTGATGFIGAFILHELLKAKVNTFCIVRCTSQQNGMDRIIDTLESYSFWSPAFRDLVHVVEGDISKPFFGLTGARGERYTSLANNVSTIIHSAGLVDWLLPLSDYVGPNIISAHEILRLASSGVPKTVHLISTISTLPKHMGLELTEGDMEYGYGTSKYIAERLFSAARWRGASTCVWRLPYATASSTTGHFRKDRGDFLHNLILGCLELGAFPSVNADMSAVLPVDYLAKTIVAVVTRDFHRLGKDYDFLNKQAVSCSEFFRTLGNVAGQEIAEMPFGQWKEMVMGYAEENPGSPLARITAVLDNYTEENAASMFKGSIVGANVFGEDDYPAPALDREFVKAYLSQIRSDK